MDATMPSLHEVALLREELELRKMQIREKDSEIEMLKRKFETKAMQHESLKSVIRSQYMMLRNMDDINSNKINYVGIAYDSNVHTFRVFRQQQITIANSFDSIKRDAVGPIELFKPRKNERLERTLERTNLVVYGDPIKCAHGVNVWNAFRAFNKDRMFGLSFRRNLNNFILLTEEQLRQKYRHFANGECLASPNHGGYTRRMRNYYESLARDIDCADEEECVRRCFVPDIWFLLQQLRQYQATNGIDNIEKVSIAGSLIPDEDDNLCEDVTNLKDDEMISIASESAPEGILGSDVEQNWPLCKRARFLEDQ